MDIHTADPKSPNPVRTARRSLMPEDLVTDISSRARADVRNDIIMISERVCNKLCWRCFIFFGVGRVGPRRRLQQAGNRR